jgi:hypothetical protein
MANLTIEGRAKTLPDIQRNWMWELLIPAISDVTQGVMGDVEDLVIRARTVVIPSRGNEPIESQFIGMKQFFPGKPTFGNTFEVTIEETEDQIVHKALTAWQNLIFNISPTLITGGQSLRPLKRDVAKDVYLLMYKYNGTEMENKIRFYNCFVQNVGDVSMAYNANEAVQFSTTFQFDFWELV